MGYPKYDPAKHLLVDNYAHKRRMDRKETDRLVRETTLYGYDPESSTRRIEFFKVKLPEFPPVRRVPLAISFGGDDPWKVSPWEGVKLACRRSWWTNRELSRIAGEIVPNIRMPKRIAYQWRVKLFCPKKHIPIKQWCKLNDIDIVDFYKALRKESHSLGPHLIIETVNPYRLEEKRGSYAPTSECIPRQYLFLAEKLCGLKESKLPDIPEWPGYDYDSPEPRICLPKIKIDTEVYKMIASHEVKAALKKRVNQSPGRFWRRRVHYFGDNLSDKAMYCPPKKEIEQFLKDDPSDMRSYVKDEGRKNYDCDDFALALKTAASKKGINSCGIIWGDFHAWNFFVIKGSDGPEFLFIEPQTDGEILELSGDYSIRKRCAVYL